MNTKNNRVQLLNIIIHADNHLESAMTEISSHNWDFDGKPIFLEKSHLQNILSRFLSGEITADFVHKWADFIELREDIDYPQEDQNLISDIISVLANPEINGQLTSEGAHDLVTQLRIRSS